MMFINITHLLNTLLGWNLSTTSSIETVGRRNRIVGLSFGYGGLSSLCIGRPSTVSRFWIWSIVE